MWSGVWAQLNLVVYLESLKTVSSRYQLSGVSSLTGEEFIPSLLRFLAEFLCGCRTEGPSLLLAGGWRLPLGSGRLKAIIDNFTLMKTAWYCAQWEKQAQVELDNLELWEQPASSSGSLITLTCVEAVMWGNCHPLCVSLLACTCTKVFAMTSSEKISLVSSVSLRFWEQRNRLWILALLLTVWWPWTSYFNIPELKSPQP